MPALDVLICTCERPDHVLDAARDAREQLGPDDRLLVYDQSLRVQPTRQALQSWGDPRVRHVAGPRLGLPAARNAALALTERPLVVFLDDDVRLEPGCLQAHRQALQQDGIGGTVGAIEERGMAWNARRTMNRVGPGGRVHTCLQGTRAVDVQSVKGCNMGFRRQVLQAVGGFDPGYRGTAFLEETDVSERVRRAGWRLRFVPQAALVHLSAPAGGVRVGDPQRTSWWRFHNTGRFLARNRPAALPRAWLVFSAIAARRALEWGRPAAAAELLRAFALGAATAGSDAW